MIANFDNTRVKERLGDQLVSRLGRLAGDLKVHCLYQETFTLVSHALFNVIRFAEPDDRATQGGSRAFIAVAMQTA